MAKENKTEQKKEVKKDVKKGFFGSIRKEKPKYIQPTVELKKPIEDPFSVIRFVLMTEKSIRMVETQNKLVFIVRRSSRKNEIKYAVEKAFETPVSDVATVIDQDGRKKAFVKFKTAGAAGDIAIKLGVI